MAGQWPTLHGCGASSVSGSFGAGSAHGGLLPGGALIPAEVYHLEASGQPSRDAWHRGASNTTLRGETFAIRTVQRICAQLLKANRSAHQRIGMFQLASLATIGEKPLNFGKNVALRAV